ncbi:hypothetical protein E5D57_012233 [Metarhizium anisopliae]|nr:hypothetical protein E5D57_012233 [Metarhizium anisopliae]
MVLQRRWVQRVLEEKLKASEESRNPVAAPKEKPTTADSFFHSHGDPPSPSQVNELNSAPQRQLNKPTMKILSDADWGFRLEGVTYSNVKIRHGVRDRNMMCHFAE